MYAAKEDYERYYKHLWPVAWEVLGTIATLGGRYALEQREIAPRWNTPKGETVMQRFRIFRNAEELAAFCSKDKPHGLQFGGIYQQNHMDAQVLADSEDPERLSRETDRFLTKNKITNAMGEVVIDVDIGGYNRKNVCSCAEKDICSVCWRLFMDTARKVLDYWLRTVWKFKGVFYSFSGRRGFHAWILDPRVHSWNNEFRASFVLGITQALRYDTQMQHILKNILIPALETAPIAFKTTLQGNEDAIIDALYPIIDLPVTTDAGHLKGLPLTLHQDTRFIRITLPPVEKCELFDPTRDSIQPGHMSVDMMRVFLKPIQRAIDECLK